MSYIKTLTGSKETFCLFVSWSLLLLTPSYAFSQDLNLNSTNTSVELEYQNSSDPSAADLVFSYAEPLGPGMGISSLRVTIALSAPLAPGASVSYLSVPGTLGSEQPNAMTLATLNDSRDVITVSVSLTSPQVPSGNTLFFLDIKNNGQFLPIEDLTMAREGIVEIDLLDPGKWSFPESDPAVTQNVEFFPNPASQQVSVTLPSEMTKLELFDLQGKRVQEVAVGKGEPVTLPVSGLQNGTYLLQASGNGTKSTPKKMVVAH